MVVSSRGSSKITRLQPDGLHADARVVRGLEGGDHRVAKRGREHEDCERVERGEQQLRPCRVRGDEDVEDELDAGGEAPGGQQPVRPVGVPRDRPELLRPY